MLFVKCNYEIYDKDLLIIVRTFKKWHPKCANTFIEQLIKIIIDYRNLKHFITIKQFNCY